MYLYSRNAKNKKSFSFFLPGSLAAASKRSLGQPYSASYASVVVLLYQ